VRAGRGDRRHGRRALARGQAAPGPAALPGPGALRASLLGLAASTGLAIEILGDNRLAAALTHPSLSRLLHTGDGVIAVVELVSFAVAALLLRLRRPGLSVVPLLAVVGAEGVRAHPDGIVPVGSLLTTTYGRVLIVKAALVAAAASLAVPGRIWLRRAPVPVPAPGGPRSGPALATKLEVGTLAVVLSVTAVLTVLTPPQAPIRSLSYQHGTSQR
jgi:hypothetical protein